MAIDDTPEPKPADDEEQDGALPDADEEQEADEPKNDPTPEDEA